MIISLRTVICGEPNIFTINITARVLENPCIVERAWESCVNRKEHQISITNCLVDYCVPLLTGVNSTVPFRFTCFYVGSVNCTHNMWQLRFPFKGFNGVTNPLVILWKFDKFVFSCNKKALLTVDR